MARFIHNKPTAAGSTILNVGMSRMEEYAVPNENNDFAESSGGREITLTRSNSNSKIIAMGAWQGDSASSYVSGMGTQVRDSSGNALNTAYGWGYIWMNNSGNNMGGATHLFKMMTLHDAGAIGSSTGNIKVNIGWNSRDGTTNRPATYWAGDNGRDGRARHDHFGFWHAMEVAPDKIDFNSNSHAGGVG